MPFLGLTYVIIFLFSIVAFYYLIPELCLHKLGIGSWKRQFSPGVSLTFDDGPDPLYTPRLLEILAEENITCCFFLIGEKAEKYPALVKSIVDQGHLIGSHGYRHRHAWLMSPQKTWELWDKSIEVIAKITGREPDFIRPPYGGFNLSLFFWSLARNKRIVLWNAAGKDWRSNRSPSSIADSILAKSKEGSIILLHDSDGDAGAPDNTLACIRELCTKIKTTRKLPIVPLHFPDWSLARRVSFRIWESWEHLYSEINHIQRIDDHNLFRLALTRYQGPNILSEDGELLAAKGDTIGAIHFDNIRFQSVGSNLQGIGIRALKQVRQSLPDLARYISINPDFQNVKVYIGITMLNKGAKGLGFNVQEYPYANGSLVGLFQKALMVMYHPSGGKRKTESLGNKPKIVWISKDKLLEKYEKKSDYQMDTERLPS